MKTYSLIFFLIIIQSVVLSQSNADEFKISTEVMPKNIIQDLPKLYFDNNKRFLTTWWDYRDGEASTYAQWFDSSGNPVGENLKFVQAGKIAFRDDGHYLAVSEYGQSSGIDAYIVSLNGNFYDKENDIINTKPIMDEVDVSIYNDDWFEKSYDIVSAVDSYIFCRRYYGNMYISRYDKAGESKADFRLETFANPLNASAAVNENGEYIVAYFNGKEGLDGQDILPPGIYASFFSKNDSLIAKDVLIDLFEGGSEYTWFLQDDLPDINIVSIEDSLFQVFWIYKDSTTLNFSKYNNQGVKLDTTKKLILPHSSLGHNEGRKLTNFTFSNFYNNEFAAFLSLSEGNNQSTKNSNVLIHFNNAGDITEIKTDTTELLPLGKQAFYSGENKFYTVAEDNGDVFLTELNDFTVINKIKINDSQPEDIPNRFFPLEVGNRWDYLVDSYMRFGNFSQYTLSISIIDTQVVIQDHKYFVFSEDLPFAFNVKYAREEDDKIIFLNKYDSSDCLAYRFDLSEGDSYLNCRGDSFQIDEKDTIIWGVPDIQQQHNEFIFSEHFGMIYCFTGSLPELTIYLKGCIISGVTYGELLTSVDDDNAPKDFYLEQNYPNPFNPTTKIKYAIGSNSRQFVTLKVYDVLGREVATLVDEEKQAGNYTVEFNIQQTTDHRQLSSGVYYYKLQAGNYSSVKKMILMK